MIMRVALSIYNFAQSTMQSAVKLWRTVGLWRTGMLCAIALGVGLTTGCSTTEGYKVVEGVMLGTNMRIVSDAGVSPTRVLQRAMELDHELKREMSIFDPSSLLSQINRSESDSLTPALIYNITLADSISELSGGVFDITVLPLVRAWGFAGAEATKEPNIDSLLQFVGYKRISIEQGRLIKEDPRTQIDLNAIAKGYGVDRLAQIVEELGAKNYLVDIGGEIRCKGVNHLGNGWRIGIESPIDGNLSNGDYLEARIEIGGTRALCAMATSGNYRRYYIDNQGRKITHTIDPRSGKASPSTLLSVTVIAATCAEADALATSILAMGDRQAEEYAKQLKGVDYYMIFGDSTASTEYRYVISEGMEQRLLR